MARSRLSSCIPWRVFVSAMFLLVFCGAAVAQYTDRQAIDDIALDKRFQKVLRARVQHRRYFML